MLTKLRSDLSGAEILVVGAVFVSILAAVILFVTSGIGYSPEEREIQRVVADGMNKMYADRAKAGLQ